jgi:hypothetical protein
VRAGAVEERSDQLVGGAGLLQRDQVVGGGKGRDLAAVIEPALDERLAEPRFEEAHDLADDGVRGGRCRHFGGGRPAGEESCREQDEGEGDRGGERRRQRAAVENGGPFPAHGAHRLADCSREGPSLADLLRQFGDR